MLEQVRTIDKARLGARFGIAGEREMARVDAAIAVSPGLVPRRNAVPLCDVCARRFRDAGYWLDARDPGAAMTPFVSTAETARVEITRYRGRGMPYVTDSRVDWASPGVSATSKLRAPQCPRR